MAKGIRALLDTVMQALPQVGNLGLLFFLLFFIFAALGVELFGRLECDEFHPCQGLGEHAHFKNFGMAFLTLFRVATGDNWNGIMKDTIREECTSNPDCVKNCCLYPFVAPIFFVIFVLMAQFVLVNVVVAVLMKHLEESHKQMEDEYDMDVEIERQIAQEEEDMAEMQENLSNLKIAQENLLMLKNAVKDEDSSKLTIPTFLHQPLSKIPSLPDNFTYRGHRGSDSGVSYFRGSPLSGDATQKRGDITYTIPSINITDHEVSQRDSVHITIYPKERRIPSVQRAQSMSKDDRLPPYPRYRVEVLPPYLLKGARPRTSPSLPKSSPSIRQGKQDISNKECGLSRELSRKGSSKRVKIDPSAGGDSVSLKDGSSPRGQRQRQLKWYNRRKSSSGSCKISMDDSISQSLMASFEIAGRVDVDSTSCSLCSSEEASNMSSSLGNSPINPLNLSPKNRRGLTKNYLRTAVLASQSEDIPCDDEDEATLASSSDSFTFESVPPDLPSAESSSLSEAAANLPLPPSPSFPRRQDRQVRSVHGMCPRPRPSSAKNALSSSLNELPRGTRRGSLPCSEPYFPTTSSGSAPHSPNLQRKCNELNLQKTSTLFSVSSDYPLKAKQLQNS